MWVLKWKWFNFNWIVFNLFLIKNIIYFYIPLFFLKISKNWKNDGANKRSNWQISHFYQITIISMNILFLYIFLFTNIRIENVGNSWIRLNLIYNKENYIIMIFYIYSWWSKKNFETKAFCFVSKVFHDKIVWKIK